MLICSWTEAECYEKMYAWMIYNMHAMQLCIWYIWDLSAKYVCMQFVIIFNRCDGWEQHFICLKSNAPIIYFCTTAHIFLTIKFYFSLLFNFEFSIIVFFNFRIVCHCIIFYALYAGLCITLQFHWLYYSIKLPFWLSHNIYMQEYISKS